MISDVLKWIAFVLVAMAVQTSLVPTLALFGAQPDLLLIVLFSLAITHGMMPGLLVGFLLGLCQDLYSPAVLGQNALAKTMTGFFVGLFNERLMRTDPIMKIVIMLIAFGLHDLIYIVVEIMRAGSPVGTTLLWILTKTIPRAAYSVVLVLFFYLWRSYLRAPLIRG